MSEIPFKVDEDHDRRMDFKARGTISLRALQEFQWCMSMCGLKMSRAKAEAGKRPFIALPSRF